MRRFEQFEEHELNALRIVVSSGDWDRAHDFTFDCLRDEIIREMVAKSKAKQIFLSIT